MLQPVGGARALLLSAILAAVSALAGCTPTNKVDFEIVKNADKSFDPPAPWTGPPIPMPPATGGIGDIKPLARFYEAIRIASVVTPPVFVDPRFSQGDNPLFVYKPGLLKSGLYRTPGTIETLLPDYGYVSGMRIKRAITSGASESLESWVLAFKDEASAKAIVDIGYGLRDLPTPGETRRATPIDIPGIPEAKAYEWQEGEGRSARFATTAFVQRGTLVIRVEVGQVPERTELLRRYLERQLQAVKDFIPTPLDQLPSMPAPFDPDNKLLTTITETPDRNSYGSGAVLDANGGLLFEAQSPAWADDYRDAGVDRYIVGDANVTSVGLAVTRAADEPGATKVLEQYRKQYSSAQDLHPETPPASVPSASCYSNNYDYWRCVFVRGRQVARVEATQKHIAEETGNAWNRLA